MFAAKYASTCGLCNQPIIAGQQIKSLGLSARTYGHIDCRTYNDFALVQELEADAQYEEWCAEQYAAHESEIFNASWAAMKQEAADWEWEQERKAEEAKRAWKQSVETWR